MAVNTKGMYVANRDVTISTTVGHTLAFKKDEPRYAPPAIRKELVGYGILPVEGEELPQDLPAGSVEKKAEVEPPVGEEREAAIRETLLMIRDENNRESFTGTGAPKVEAIEALVGFNIHSKERDAIWREILQAEA